MILRRRLTLYYSVEKTRKYFFWTMIVTLVIVVVPLFGLAFIIPLFMDSYVGSLRPGFLLKNGM